MKTLVFLHIPKTAGQTVHSELARIVGKRNVSPVRVHTQAEDQFPAGYKLYSGHLDWTGLDQLPKDRFSFSVLRDPRERIASFYMYLLKEAQSLTPEQLAQPGHLGKAKILNNSADDYFFGGNQGWQVFVKDHYDNFYCSYFATRRMRGWRMASNLDARDLLTKAESNAKSLDRIYMINTLADLEEDILSQTGAQIKVAQKFVNVGPNTESKLRWPALLGRLEKDRSVRLIDQFVHHDMELLHRLNIT